MTLSFADALRRAGRASIIAEIKPRSPKHRDLLAGRDIACAAEDFARGGAACLSVTTGPWHGGTIAMIGDMRGAGLPILRKDFIVSRTHLLQTRNAGAGAALLTATLLRRDDLVRLAGEALDLGLTPFVEVANRGELAGLALPQEAVLAINNRNIREREVDEGGVERSIELVRAARRCHGGLLVSASGLNGPADVGRALSSGFDGVLIGTALLQHPAGLEAAVAECVRAARPRAA